MTVTGGTWLVCIDMQRIFLEPGIWYCRAGVEILPQCKRLVGRIPDQCIFTRFFPVKTPVDAKGSWQEYYRKWQSVTLDSGGAEPVEIHKDLKPFAQPHLTFDKSTFDCFASGGFAKFVDAVQPAAIVAFGVETDACVLATVLSAIDRGIKTIIPVDAVASGDARAHKATVDLIFPRFAPLIELTDTESVSKRLGSF